MRSNKNKSPSKRKNKSVTQVSAKMQYAGPIPIPSMLEGYERILPGSADRIISMAERQVNHRIELEKKVVDTQAKAQLWGIGCAFLITAMVICASVYIVSMGHTLEGIGTMILGLASLVGVFIYGKYINKKELIEKQKLMNNF